MEISNINGLNYNDILTDIVASKGCILLPRTLKETKLWQNGSALELKIFLELILNACYVDTDKIKKGNAVVNINKMVDSLAQSKDKPNYNNIKSVIDKLKTEKEEQLDKITSINVTRTTRGLNVNIEAYDFYNDLTIYNKTKKEVVSEISNDADEETKELLEVLKSIPNYPFDFKTDCGKIKEYIEEFPALNLLEAIKDWKAYKFDKPLTPKCNPRSQLRTALKKNVEWGRNLKSLNKDTPTKKLEYKTKTLTIDSIL